MQIKLRRENLGVVATVLILLLFPFMAILLWEPERFETWADEVKVPFLSKLISSIQGFEDRIGFNEFKKAKEGFWRSAKTPPSSPSYENDTPVVPVESKEIKSSGGELGTVEPAEHKKVQPPIKVLIIGDSLVLEGFGPSLEQKLLGYNGVTVFRRGYYSTGLTRPDYFDWNLEVKKLLDQNHPNVVIVMFGANDGQTIVTEAGKKEGMGTAGWKAEYEMRVDKFMSIMDNYAVLVFWIGNPIAESEYYSNKMRIINDCVQAVIPRHQNVHFISTWEIMADSNGKFAWYLPDESGIMQRMRASDGIHCTTQGGARMAKYVIEKMSEFIEFK